MQLPPVLRQPAVSGGKRTFKLRSHTALVQPRSRIYGSSVTAKRPPRPTPCEVGAKLSTATPENVQCWRAGSSPGERWLSIVFGDTNISMSRISKPTDNRLWNAGRKSGKDRRSWATGDLHLSRPLRVTIAENPSGLCHVRARRRRRGAQDNGNDVSQVAN